VKKGKEMPIEIVDCYHALPVEVTENGIVSTQKIGTKVLAIKTRKDDIPVLVGNLSKMINPDKVNIFNDPSDLVGIVNPHPIVHAIPFRASNRYQHILLSKHKKFMDIRQAPFFIQENIDRVIHEQKMGDYMTSYPQISAEDNTLRRIIMTLTNNQGNQAAEAIYSTHRSDYVISCLQGDSKVIADFCDLHALSYKNMWDKFDPNYESDLTKDMKALVEAINLEETGFYMAPGKTISPSQIAPSAWTKKPKIVTDHPTTPAALRLELKRTEDTLAQTMSTELQKITANHEQQLQAMAENHSNAMETMNKKFEALTSHAQHQTDMIHDLFMRNDKDQMQITEGFEKIDKNITANEQSIELIYQDFVKAQETSTKGQRTVVRALQQNMETTAKSFQIISDEMTCVRNEIDEMSQQADMMEESFDKSCEQVDFIFKKFEEQASLPRGRGNSKNKRDRSRSVSSSRTNTSTDALRWSKKRQTEIFTLDDEDDTSTNGIGNESLSTSDDDDGVMGSLQEVNEDEELNLSDLEIDDSDEDVQDEDMGQDGDPQTQATHGDDGHKIVSGSSQGESPRR
jgi:hypothetical protein